MVRVTTATFLFRVETFRSDPRSTERVGPGGDAKPLRRDDWISGPLFNVEIPLESIDYLLAKQFDDVSQDVFYL